MAAINWPGLLAWSTNHHDGTAPSQFKKMTDEDRAFLEQAMQDAFGKIEDPNKVFEEAIQQIKSADRTEASIATALEVIDRLCDDPDVARNAEKLDGLQALIDLTRDVQGPNRTRALEVLALLFSNNPHIQEAGMKREALSHFLMLTREASQGSDERSKAFRALVALVRQMPEFETRFVRTEGGLQLLVELLSKEEENRTHEKVASFVLGMASTGVLQESEAAALAAAMAPRIADMTEATVQYRELLSSSALELARLATVECRTSLLPSVEARLDTIKKAGKLEDGDEGAELEALQTCKALF